MTVEQVTVEDALGRKRAALASIGIGIAALMLVWQCARYLILGAYVDHIEGNVVISGWQFFDGMPLYGKLQAAPVFATYYGPLAYLLEVPALALFGAGVGVSKLTSFLALAATVAAMGWHFRRHFSAEQARNALLLLLAGLLFFSPISFWVRPDPLETLLVALALVSTSSRWSAVAIGVCIGLAVNLKVHAFVYFLPLVIDLWATGGWRSVAKVAVTSGVVFLLPFLAPGISLHDYVVMLAQQITRRTHTSTNLARGVQYFGVPAILILFAFASAAQRSGGRERLYFCSILGTLALLLYPVTLPQAGLYHMLPFVPVLADAIGRLRPDNVAGRWAPIALCLGAIPLGANHLVSMNGLAGDEAVAEEALALARVAPGRSVQVGYGATPPSYAISQLSKVVLSLNGYPALVDAQILMELNYIGIDGSARWIPDLRDCHFGRWLLPRGESPFSVTSYYDGSFLFSEDFRRAFLAHYQIVDSSDHFDIWACAAAPQSR